MAQSPVFCSITFLQRPHNAVVQHNSKFIRNAAEYRQTKRRAQRETPPAPESLLLDLRPDDIIEDFARGYFCGSDRAADILLDNDKAAGVSGHHFRLYLDFSRETGDTLFLRNMARYGTIVNNENQTGEISIAPGVQTVIEAGEVSLLVQFSPILDPKIWTAVCTRADAVSSKTKIVKQSDFLGKTPRMAHNDDRWTSMDIPWHSGKKYEMLAQVGHGSTGTLRKLRSTADSRVYAVKILSVMGGQERSNLPALMRTELQILRLLTEKNAVHVPVLVDFAKLEFSTLLVQDYAAGSDLRFWLEEGQGRSEVECKEMTRQILEALNSVHSFGIIHRDVKPSNILTFSYGTNYSHPVYKLIDFGQAYCSNLRSKPKQFYGTLAYMAPEIARIPHLSPKELRKYEYNQKVDVWSLGATIWHIMVGRVPIEPANELYVEECLQLWSPVGALRGKVPSTACDLIASMLTNDHCQRPEAENCLNHVWFIRDEQGDQSPRTPSTVVDEHDQEKSGARDDGNSDDARSGTTHIDQYPDYFRGIPSPLSDASLPDTENESF